MKRGECREQTTYVPSKSQIEKYVNSELELGQIRIWSMEMRVNARWIRFSRR